MAEKHFIIYLGTVLLVKNLTAMWESWVQSLGWEDPLKKGTNTTLVFLPGESHRQRSLEGTVHRVSKSQTRLHDFHFHIGSHIFFIQSSVDGHLGYFQILAILDTVAMNKIGSSLIAQLVKNLGSIPWLGRSPGEGKGCTSQPLFPLQYSGLENSLDCIVHGVSESDTTEWLSLSL